MFGGLVVSDASGLDHQLRAFAHLLTDYDPDAMVLLIVAWDQSTKRLTMIGSGSLRGRG